MQHVLSAHRQAGQWPSARATRRSAMISNDSALLRRQQHCSLQRRPTINKALVRRPAYQGLGHKPARSKSCRILATAKRQDAGSTGSGPSSPYSGEEQEHVPRRGGEAGPGPGSMQEEMRRSQGNDPRKASLIQRIMQALGRPFLAVIQLVGSLLRTLIPGVKFRR